MRCIFFSIALALGAYGNAYGKNKTDYCFGPLRAILEKGNYSGDLDCQDSIITIKKSGKIKYYKKSFSIYQMIYSTKIKFLGQYPHGGERIFIFDGNNNYIGQYVLATPPFQKIYISDNKIANRGNVRSGKYIDIRRKIPEQVYFGGDMIGFSK